VLIYVFDAISAELDKDIHYYQSCLESILVHSPDAKVFCLIHKMDLIQEERRDKVICHTWSFFLCFFFVIPFNKLIASSSLQVFEKHKEELQVRSEPIPIHVFQTSIWDETLYAVSHCRCDQVI
jgi:Ras-related GTP-binding protein A/B